MSELKAQGRSHLCFSKHIANYTSSAMQCTHVARIGRRPNLPADIRRPLVFIWAFERIDDLPSLSVIGSEVNEHLSVNPQLNRTATDPNRALMVAIPASSASANRHDRLPLCTNSDDYNTILTQRIKTCRI